MSYRTNGPLVKLVSFFVLHLQKDYISFFKQTDRRTFSLANVNSCMSVRLSDTGSVEGIRLCYGGMNKNCVLADKTADKLKGMYVH